MFGMISGPSRQPVENKPMHMVTRLLSTQIGPTNNMLIPKKNAMIISHTRTSIHHGRRKGVAIVLTMYIVGMMVNTRPFCDWSKP